MAPKPHASAVARWYGKSCMPNVQEIAYPPELADAEAKNIDNNTSLAKMFKAVGNKNIFGELSYYSQGTISL